MPLARRSPARARPPADEASARATLLLALAVGLLHLLTLRPGAYWHGDVVQMVMHAQNLVAGAPYADTGYIQNPGHYLSPTAYPPGYPLVLAPWVALFGPSLLVVQGVTTAFLTVGAGALGLLFRRGLPAAYTYALVLAAGLQPYLWQAKHVGFSGFAVLCFAAVALLLYESASPGERAGRRRGLAVLAGLVAGYAAATHPLAWVLLPAFLGADLVRARRPTLRFALAGLGALACYGGLGLLIDVAAGARVAPSAGGFSGGYGSLLASNLLGELAQVPGRVAGRAVQYGKAAFLFWHAPLPGWGVLQYALLLASLVPVGWGWAWRARRYGAAEAFSVLYFGALLPWSFGDVRYLIPLVPLYYGYLAAGLWAMRPALGPRARWVTGVTLAALGVVYASRYTDTDARADTSDDAAVYAYLREAAPDAAVAVVSGDPRHLPFQAGVLASKGPPRAAAWPTYLERVGATYALVHEVDQDVRAVLDSLRYPRARAFGRLQLYRLPAAPPEAP